MKFLFPLAKGHSSITYPIIVLFFVSLIWVFFINPNDWFISLVSLFVLIFVIQFFRDPIRNSDSLDSSIIIAPADGVLFEITTENNVTIFRIRMRFWDVHVIRMPLSGTLLSIKKKSGSIWPLPILPGLNKISKNQNARKIHKFISTSGFEFKVVQISGTLAYRTVPYGKPNQYFDRGNKIGIIRFGSETDLHLPSDEIEIMVQPGKKTKAGLTVIAKLQKTDTKNSN